MFTLVDIHGDTTNTTLFTISLALTLCFVYVTGLVVYRRLFHPLRNVPGPFLAAASGWYEFYYDVIRGSRYFCKILKLHEQYGLPHC